MGHYKTFGMKLPIWASSILCLICFSAAFDPVDNYLVNCGSHTDTSVGDRVFMSDHSASAFLSGPRAGYTSASTAAVPKSIASSADLPLYQTAAIFSETSTYTFPIRQRGRHWIRLYFFPFDYGNYKMSTAANFSVSAQNHLLIYNFNSNKSTSTLEEYSMNVNSDTLVITFAPTQYSFAFINALEVVSCPDELFANRRVNSLSLQPFGGLSTQALETIARVNVGGPTIFAQNDTLHRTWTADKNFLIQPNSATYVSNITAVKFIVGGPTKNIAPELVYGSAAIINSSTNPKYISDVTWGFVVDPGFQYLLRFHLCDIVGEAQKKISFNIFADSSIVVQDADLSAFRANDLGVPYYLDIITNVLESVLFCASFSPFFSRIDNPIAILNGIEIMKMNNSLGNLSGGALDTNPNNGKKVGRVIMGVSIGVIVVATLVALFFFMTSKRRNKLAAQGNSRMTTSLFEVRRNACNANSEYSSKYRFPLLAIREATNNFDETLVVGVGGFGKVYKGVLTDGTRVAVKKSNPQSQQGIVEFQNELELLSQFRHRHLVSLIGYCDEMNEMILVYEYMQNGSLESHLFGSNILCLSWKQRLEICIGAARGLHYLHTGFVRPVIHRDVKSANILLDENFNARVADFGISRTILRNDQTHISTVVRGTFGYIDPEYFTKQQLTTKSDVYSFGVVLFEVLCARLMLDSSLFEEMEDLAQWTIKQQKAGKLEQMIDPHLFGQIRSNSLVKFVEIAEKCLTKTAVNRPTMEEVLFNLEDALQLQEDVIVQGDQEVNTSDGVDEHSSQVSISSQIDVSAFGG
ncbi:probable receptor-like protein kinase At5g59700 [Malania oleifera]|uniref:probable receptor-like protein kinase At5g59700 n=1 Tax=Malania oleifera TaxID=397392 RepID=UPI0025AEC29F|nr:probable receptor-like protein kinase At5g59700 [Malania oleifera]